MRSVSIANRMQKLLENRSPLELRRQPGHYRTRLLAAYGVDLVLDVGAARGRYIAELRRFGYRGRAVSFEPLGAAFRALQAVAVADPTWEVRNIALGVERGTATINLARNSDSSSLLPMLDRHEQAAPHASYVGRETITVERLDDLWSGLRGDSQAPFLKIDVQGFEGQVLDGAATTLPNLVGLQIEVSFVPLYAGGMTYREVFDRTGDAGFVPMGVEPGFRDSSTGQLLQADVVFMRDLPL